MVCLPRLVLNGRGYGLERMVIFLTTDTAGANRKRLQEAEEEARQEFSKALTSAENIGFTFPLGKHTWDRLKRSSRCEVGRELRWA